MVEESSVFCLEATHISKQIGQRYILKDCSVRLERGEIVGILGPNGAGKTTLFSILSGLQRPDEGQVFMDGHNVTHFPAYRRARLGLGYLPQETSVFRGMTVAENIRVVLEIHEPDSERRQQRLETLLSEFQLQTVRDSSAMALSGGERRRTEIARALAAKPHFILLDEPWAGIDPIAVNEVRNMLVQLKDFGIGVLVTDHNARETLGIVDRAYIIFEGGVLLSGTPQEIVESKKVRGIYLGETFSL